jgi:hypothetical protein
MPLVPACGYTENCTCSKANRVGMIRAEIGLKK